MESVISMLKKNTKEHMKTLCQSGNPVSACRCSCLGPMEGMGEGVQILTWSCQF